MEGRAQWAMIATEKLYQSKGPLKMLFVKRDQHPRDYNKAMITVAKHSRLGVGPSGVVFDRLKRKIRPDSLSSTLDRRSDETRLQKVPFNPGRPGGERGTSTLDVACDVGLTVGFLALGVVRMAHGPSVKTGGSWPPATARR
jgi:hypothetical protein